MKIELEIEESRELVAALIENWVADVDFSDADRTAFRQWTRKLGPNSEDMRELSAKINADLARTLENKKRSAIRKPDWVG